MAVPFFVCNKEEQRSVILFLWAEVCKVLKSTHLCAQHGANAPSQKILYEWIKSVKQDWTSLSNVECSGSPPHQQVMRNWKMPQP